MAAKEQKIFAAEKPIRSMKVLTLFVVSIVLHGTALASPGDSVATVAKPASPWKATARMHSRGFFSYSGRLVADNPVVDLYVTYSRKNWGVQFFKAADLSDHHTPINFAFALVNRPFHVSKRLSITPAVGMLFEQYEGLADHGTDATILITTSYRISKRLLIEHSALAGNLVLTPELCDWVNRLRLLYSRGHLDVTLFGWHNNAVFDSNSYVTTGASVFVSRLKLMEAVTLQAGITGLYMATASDAQTLKNANGVFATLGVSIN